MKKLLAALYSWFSPEPAKLVAPGNWYVNGKPHRTDSPAKVVVQQDKKLVPGTLVGIQNWDDSTATRLPTIPSHLQGQEAIVLSHEGANAYWVLPVDKEARERGNWLFEAGYLTPYL